MPSCMARSLLTLTYQMLPVLCWDRSWLLLMQTSFIQTHLKMHTQACKGTQAHLFLHISYRKRTAPTHSSFRNKFSCYWLKSALPRTHFPSLPLTDCPTLHLSPCPHNSPPPPVSSIVAISCLLCMDFDCSQGAILHLALSSHTNTYMRAHEGRKKNTCLQRICLSNVLSNHVRRFTSGHIFPAPGYPKERVQIRVRHSVISTM